MKANQGREDYAVHDVLHFAEIHREHPFDLCIYHQGNNPHHEYIYDCAQRMPGLLVLHAAVRKADGPIFATAFYMVMDTAAGEMRYASAGHPTPLIACPADKSVAPLPGAQGPALGLTEEASYTSTQRAMAAGDFVVLFTDGLYEIDGPRHEPYGQERLPNAIRNRLKMSPSLLFDELIGSIRDFAVSHEFNDDVCLVGMEVVRVGSGATS